MIGEKVSNVWKIKFLRKWKGKDWKDMKNGRKETGPVVQCLTVVPEPKT